MQYAQSYKEILVRSRKYIKYLRLLREMKNRENMEMVHKHTVTQHDFKLDKHKAIKPSGQKDK